MSGKFSISNELKQRIAEHKEFLIPAGKAAASENANWRLKVSDPQSHFTREDREGRWEISLTLPVDDDADPANGRIFLYDHFVIESKNAILEKYEREWRLAPEVPKELQGELEAVVRKLNRGDDPSIDEAVPFIDALLPAMLKATPIPEDPPKKEDSRLFQSPWNTPAWALRAELKEKTKIGAVQGWATLESLLQEKSEKELDRARGWFHTSREEKNAPYSRQEILKAIRRKALKATEAFDFSSPFQLLRQLDLSDVEQAFVARVLADPLSQKIEAISQNPDSETRAHEFVHLARELAIDHELPETASFIAQSFAESPTSQAEARRLISLRDGSGTLGVKMEFLTPRFVREILSPSLLLPMMAAPFAGVAAESFFLSRLSLRSLGGHAAHFWRNLVHPWHVAELAGLAAEGTAFTTLHHALASAVQDPERIWKTWGLDTGAVVLSFGFMRLAHLGTGWIGNSLADPRFNRWATQGKTSWRYPITPLGRIGTQSYFGTALNWKGQVLSEALHHLAGISACYLAGQLSQRAHLQKGNPQGKFGDLFDSVLFYFNALIGFNLANKLSYGRLQGDLVEARLRMERKGNLGPGSPPEGWKEGGSEPPKPPMEPVTLPEVRDASAEIQELQNHIEVLTGKLDISSIHEGTLKNHIHQMENQLAETRMQLQITGNEFQVIIGKYKTKKKEFTELIVEVEGLRKQVAREMARAQFLEAELRKLKAGKDPEEPKK